VHDEQFGMYFPRWQARFGRFLEGPVARRAYRRHACVAVSPSTVRAMRERLAWTGPIYIVPNGVTPPEAPGDAPPPGATRDGTTPEVTTPAGTARDGAMPEARGGRAPDGTAPGGARPDGTEFDGSGPESAMRGVPDGTAPGERPHPAAPGEAVELVCVSRLVPHKRVAELLDVAERLRLRLHVIGRGPEEPALRAQIDRRGLTGLVELHGYLPEADKNALVARARLHLCASRGEGWGLSVTEAAALGVPTVAYDVDGLRDAVLDGVTGWLARDGEDLADVAERALKELADPACRRDVAAACRAWAAEFAWARSAERMAALLDASIRRGGSGRPEGAALPDAVVVRYGDVERVVEGPVRDETLARLADATRIEMRPATGRERLLGRTGRWT
jgi:glycosyltransferase involved in cell wall biosynthesis